MPAFDSMQIFLRVAELGSFTQAAQTMGLPKASVSTAVQRLEASLGTRLLQRTTRRVELTHDGRAYYERCKDVLADLDELQSMFQASRTELRGRLRVDMPQGVARRIVIPQLPDFLRAHPHIEIEVSSTDRRVDLIREGFDCVLRVGTLTDSSLIARPLGALRMGNYASPAYLADHGTPQSLDDLARHALVHYLPVLGAKSSGFEYVDEHDETRFVPMAGRVSVNNSDAYTAACLAGLGIIQSPARPMRRYIDQGLLVEVLPQWRARQMPVSILYANRRHLPKRLRVFMDWLAERLRPGVEPA
jgi:DNA-binding transcriptional LysR family regulator